MRHPAVLAAISPTSRDWALTEVVDMAWRWADAVVLLGDDNFPVSEYWDDGTLIVSVPGIRAHAAWWAWAWRRLITEASLIENDVIVPLTGSEVVYEYQDLRSFVRASPGMVLDATRYKMMDFQGNYSASWPFEPARRPLTIPVTDERATFYEPWWPRYALAGKKRLETHLRTQEYSFAFDRVRPRMTPKPFDGEVLIDEPDLISDGGLGG